MTTLPNFYGLKHENASYFLDDLEMALLTSGRDEDNVKVRAFSLVLRDAAKSGSKVCLPRRELIRIRLGKLF